MPDHNTLTQSEQVAILLGHNGLQEEPHTPAAQLASIRIPHREFVKIKAMTSLANISRSAMINRLLKVGIESVEAELDPDAAERYSLAVEACTDMEDEQ